MSKATTTTRTTSPRPAATTARPSQATTTRAAQAAQHQGRAEPPPEVRTTAPTPAPTASVPAEAKNYAPPVSADADINNLPDFMRGDVGMGKEALGREDLETPRLKLMQGLSPELQAYDVLRPGHFFHTSAEFVFDGPFLAVPLFIDKRVILWRPRDSGGGILARADDGEHWSPSHGEFEVTLDRIQGGNKVTWRLAPTVAESGLTEWGTMNPADPRSPPAATKMYSYVLAFPEYPELGPAVVTFQRSSFKRGRVLNSQIMIPRAPVFAQIYQFSSFMDKNSNGQEFFNMSTTRRGLVEDPELYRSYKELHLSFKQAGLTVRDIESLQDENADTAEEPEAAGPKF